MITFSEYLKCAAEFLLLGTSLVVIVGMESKLKAAIIANHVFVYIVVVFASSGPAFSLVLAMTVSQICRKKSHIPYTHTMWHPVRTFCGREEI
jgi:hypothetical protein